MAGIIQLSCAALFLLWFLSRGLYVLRFSDAFKESGKLFQKVGAK